MKEQQHKRIIISGGGTGGHIFPAISIANALKAIDHNIDLLFVGAEGRMEMDKVPASGYRIIGLPVEGLSRKLSLRNIVVLFKVLRSLIKASRIIREFKPHVAVGVGGYASGPLLRRAGAMGIPTLIQEQNSYAGVTNRLLAKKASKICVAYEGMDKYFDRSKLILTGNPVRKDISEMKVRREDALSSFGFNESKPVVLILGGSLGSATINNSVLDGLGKFKDKGCQLIWQTGKYYYDSMKDQSSGIINNDIKVLDFIDKMENAYAAADIIVSRAGAGTISELCLTARPVILVPSPNVAEDHQTMNALALSEKDAAITIADKDAGKQLVDTILELIDDENRREMLGRNISGLAIRDSDVKIANEILKLAE
jgi:UDP-N-acetylglucosamine--N-acetylmuramyl-(pentapeptide) pyrophosphoryl-undecaprenol N-acetylglucosamine transferase